MNVGNLVISKNGLKGLILKNLNDTCPGLKLCNLPVYLIYWFNLQGTDDVIRWEHQDDISTIQL